MQTVRGRVRRAVQTAAAVLLAALVAGLRAMPLPFGGGPPPLDLGLTGSERPVAVAEALVRALAAHPVRRRSRPPSSPPPPCCSRSRRGRGTGARPRSAPRCSPATLLAARGGPRSALVLTAWATAVALAWRSGAGRASSRRSGAGSLATAPGRAGRRSMRSSRLAAGKPTAVSVLRSIEQKIEGLFEGVFGRAFRTHVQPVELARKLVKEMEDHKVVSVSRVYVPNEYTVYLAPDDREQFANYEPSLLGELQDYLAEHARRENYALLTPPRVLLETDDDLGDGRVRDRDADGAADRRAGASRRPRRPRAAGRDDDLPRRSRRRPRPRSPTRRPSSSARSSSLTRERRPPRADTQRRGRSAARRSATSRSPDPNISRRHAEIVQEGASYWIVDLDSTNGLEVNGRADEAGEARATATGSRSARPSSCSSARRRDLRLDPGRRGAPRPEGALPRAALPLHLADRPQRRAATCARRRRASSSRPARRRRAARAAAPRRAGRLVVVSSPVLGAATSYALDSAPLTIGRGSQNDVAARRRRVRLGAPRARRAAPRRRLGRGRRLDERHLRQRAEARRGRARARPPATSSGSARPS